MIAKTVKKAQQPTATDISRHERSVREDWRSIRDEYNPVDETDRLRVENWFLKRTLCGLTWRANAKYCRWTASEALDAIDAFDERGCLPDIKRPR